MIKFIPYFMVAIVVAFSAFPVSAAIEVGKTAPNFVTTDINGDDIDISQFKGKRVVLEWTNDQCPFVIKHYSTGNMQATQKQATDDGVVWISIVSSAEGKQGHVDADKAADIIEREKAHPTYKILDPSGEIGKQYGAVTTPHMFVINEEGVLVYAGAIDDNPSPRPITVEGATNYVLAALDDLDAGIDVQVPQSRPYGCSVKY